MVIILHFIELIIISVKPAITTEFFTLSKNSPMTLVTQTRKIRVTFNFSLFYYHAGSSMTGTLLSISALDLIQAVITLDQIPWGKVELLLITHLLLRDRQDESHPCVPQSPAFIFTNASVYPLV